MRRSILMVVVGVVMAGCAVDPTPPTPPPLTPAPQHAQFDPTSTLVNRVITDDVCTLAAQLPSGDICALMCSPDAMKAQLRAEGEPAGTCLEFSCALPDDSHVIVGVCLPPV